MHNPIITKVFHFCAAHQYGHKDWEADKNRKVFGLDAQVHGHNYELEVMVTGEVDKDTGFVIDLEKLKRIVDEHVINVLDHSQIEKDIPWFRDRQPSSENLVIYIWTQLEEHLLPVRLVRVRLRETPTIFTDYYGTNNGI
jgi:6-pyruvoyltetrahydropterin/6-carboxytetrahydropterin synthase